MKSCRNNREAIVLLAAGELAPEEAERLRVHAQACPGCARYLREMTTVSETLLAGTHEPEVEASASFHSLVLSRLRSQEPATGWSWFERLTLIEKWGMATAAVAVALVLVSAVFLRTSHAPPRDIANNTVERHDEPELAPTLSNYHVVANHSLEQFDELLTRQANRALPRAPLYTPSSGSAGNGWD